MAFGSSVLTHKKEQQIKIEGEFKPTVDCLCATRRRFVFIHKGIDAATARNLFDVASSGVLDKFVGSLVNKRRIHNVISFRGWHSE